MTYVPDSFMQADAAMTTIVQQATRTVERFENKVSDISALSTELSNMSQSAPIGWLGAIQYINDQAAANPGDAAWQDLKARSDKIVADFQNAQTRIAGAVTALSGI